MEKVILVSVKFKSEKNSWLLEDSAEELEELAESCNVGIVDHVLCTSERPTPNLLIGKGKTEEIAIRCEEEGADTVIFGSDLSGTQQRNLEEVIGRKTIDRTQLILDIFARHARSPEGKMQVELAQLQYLLPRLIGKGIILSRLGGGIGTRGPGEQKLEVDRRRIRKKIDRLKNDLRSLAEHRIVTKNRRKENAIPSVVLIGYTNAGKSTLLNALTGAGQIVSDGLFTTLDPLYKRLKLSNGEDIVISDTVGFLHNLPHHLIEAFKTTLEEAIGADLLVHVLDISHPKAVEHNKAVFEVLKELKADNKPVITALNKIDQLADNEIIPRLEKDFQNPVVISAKLKTNLDGLLKKIEDNFQGRMIKAELLLPHSRMDLVNLMYKQAKIEDVNYTSEGIKVRGILPKILYHKILSYKDIRLVS